MTDAETPLCPTSPSPTDWSAQAIIQFMVVHDLVVRASVPMSVVDVVMAGVVNEPVTIYVCGIAHLWNSCFQVFLCCPRLSYYLPFLAPIQPVISFNHTRMGETTKGECPRLHAFPKQH